MKLLKSRVFNVSIQEKYTICLFSKVEACQKTYVDVVDESGSTAKFDKKQEKKLEKLKDQLSKTAGLETTVFSSRL